MQLNDQLLITYECVSAVGTSLDLKKMIEHFLKVFSRKTGAIASIYWEFKEIHNSYEPLCIYGKKSFQTMMKLPESALENYAILHDKESGKNLLHVKLGSDWIVFVFYADKSDLSFIKAIIASFSSKLENAICACKNHLELLAINQSLEKRVEEEVQKNRQKDQHILQQSRLAQMGEMISMIAHQWRQPLGSISAVVASMKLKILLNKFDLSTADGRTAHTLFTNDSLNKIEEFVRFLTNTIDDFRNFFKPDKQKERVPTSKLVGRTLEIIGKALEINGIDIKIEHCATREVLTYTNELTQVILNILKNAEDVIKERSISPALITITTREMKGYQVIEIEDNAGGIPEHVLPHIFEPYYSTKNEKNGTGLGLYMSKIIIEEHCQGSIQALNTQTGAKFIVMLQENEEHT